MQQARRVCLLTIRIAVPYHSLQKVSRIVMSVLRIQFLSSNEIN